MRSNLRLQLRERLAALQDRGRALSELQRHLVRTKQQLVSCQREEATLFSSVPAGAPSGTLTSNCIR